MNVQTIKKDELGLPVRAKVRIVVLSNLEDTIWNNTEVHAPVLRKESDQLLTTLAVDIGKPQKQGDCKNAFCHPVFPDDETIIVCPPPGCPLSQPGELWLLRKTLYGLRCGPKHWYEALRVALLKIDMNPCAHNPCVFTGVQMKGEPPRYLGVYVNNFTYVSDSDAVGGVFKQSLSLELKIDWMGDVAWLLGTCYDWQTNADDNITVSITQTAKIEAMLEDFDMNCNAVRAPTSPA
jgi:hypothetical protein